MEGEDQRNRGPPPQENIPLRRRNRQLQPTQQVNLLNGSRELEQRIEFIRFRQQTDWLLQHGTRDLPFENPGQREIPVGAPARRSIVSGSSGQGNIHMRPPDQRNIPTPAMRDANHWTIRQQGIGTPAGAPPVQGTASDGTNMEHAAIALITALISQMRQAQLLQNFQPVQQLAQQAVQQPIQLPVQQPMNPGVPLQQAISPDLIQQLISLQRIGHPNLFPYFLGPMVPIPAPDVVGTPANAEALPTPSENGESDRAAGSSDDGLEDTPPPRPSPPDPISPYGAALAAPAHTTPPFSVAEAAPTVPFSIFDIPQLTALFCSAAQANPVHFLPINTLAPSMPVVNAPPIFGPPALGPSVTLPSIAAASTSAPDSSCFRRPVQRAWNPHTAGSPPASRRASTSAPTAPTTDYYRTVARTFGALNCMPNAPSGIPGLTNSQFADSYYTAAVGVPPSRPGAYPLTRRTLDSIGAAQRTSAADPFYTPALQASTSRPEAPLPLAGSAKFAHAPTAHAPTLNGSRYSTPLGDALYAAALRTPVNFPSIFGSGGPRPIMNGTVAQEATPVVNSSRPPAAESVYTASQRQDTYVLSASGPIIAEVPAAEEPLFVDQTDIAPVADIFRPDALSLISPRTPNLASSSTTSSTAATPATCSPQTKTPATGSPMAHTSAANSPGADTADIGSPLPRAAVASSSDADGPVARSLIDDNRASSSSRAETPVTPVADTPAANVSAADQADNTPEALASWSSALNVVIPSSLDEAPAASNSSIASVISPNDHTEAVDVLSVLGSTNSAPADDSAAAPQYPVPVPSEVKTATKKSKAKKTPSPRKPSAKSKASRKPASRSPPKNTMSPGQIKKETADPLSLAISYPTLETPGFHTPPLRSPAAPALELSLSLKPIKEEVIGDLEEEAVDEEEAGYANPDVKPRPAALKRRSSDSSKSKVKKPRNNYALKKDEEEVTVDCEYCHKSVPLAYLETHVQREHFGLSRRASSSAASAKIAADSEKELAGLEELTTLKEYVDSDGEKDYSYHGKLYRKKKTKKSASNGTKK